jgi:hypothetical protein
VNWSRGEREKSSKIEKQRSESRGQRAKGRGQRSQKKEERRTMMKWASFRSESHRQAAHGIGKIKEQWRIYYPFITHLLPIYLKR